MKIEFGKSHKFNWKGTAFEVGLAVASVYLVRIIVKVQERALALCLFGFVMIVKLPLDLVECPECKGKRGKYRPATKDRPAVLEMCASCQGHGKIPRPKKP